MDPFGPLGLGVELIKWVKGVAAKKIVITPEKIELGGPSRWKKTSAIYLQNRTNEVLFTIQVLCWYDDRKVDSISFSADHTPDLKSISNIEVDSSIQIIEGVRNNKNFYIISVSKINPSQIIEIKLETEGHGVLKFNVVSFNKDSPPATLQDESRIAVQFKPPFDMQVRSIGWIMRKKQ